MMAFQSRIWIIDMAWYSPIMTGYSFVPSSCHPNSWLTQIHGTLLLRIFPFFLACLALFFLLPACFVRNGWSRERAFRVWERVKLCSSQSVNGKKKISRRKVIFSLQFAGAVSPDFFATLFCVKKESARKNKRISPVFSHTCCSDIRVLSFAGQRKREFLRCREYFGPEMRTVRNVVC